MLIVVCVYVGLYKNYEIITFAVLVKSTLFLLLQYFGVIFVTINKQFECFE